MTLVDDHGRLFGRLNVVDALIGIVLLGLIPVLYARVRVVQAPAASLVSIEPARIEAENAKPITVHGINLRPYMRVSFDDHQGRSFLFTGRDPAVVHVPISRPVSSTSSFMTTRRNGRGFPRRSRSWPRPGRTTEVD